MVMGSSLVHGNMCSVLMVYPNMTLVVERGPQWPSGTAGLVSNHRLYCHLCVGSTPTSGNAVDLAHCDPGC